MALQAYIDGSGTRGQHGALVLAGFIAPAENWAAFSEEWDGALKVPLKIASFKMNEAVRLIGQFDSFSEARRDERLRLLYRIIEDHVTAFVSYIIPFAAFDAAVAGIPREYMKVHPYHMVFVAMLGDFAAKKGIPIGLNERVDFIFDEEVMERTALLESWDEIIANTPAENQSFVSKTPIFRDDKDVLPLQAADLIAWLRRNTWEADNGGMAAYNPPWQPQRTIPGLDGMLDEKQLKAIINSSVEKTAKLIGTRPPWEAPRA